MCIRDRSHPRKWNIMGCWALEFPSFITMPICIWLCIPQEDFRWHVPLYSLHSDRTAILNMPCFEFTQSVNTVTNWCFFKHKIDWPLSVVFVLYTHTHTHTHKRHVLQHCIPVYSNVLKPNYKVDSYINSNHFELLLYYLWSVYCSEN